MKTGQQQEIFLNSLLALMAVGIFFASKIFVPPKIIFIAAIISVITAIYLVIRENKFAFVPYLVIFFLIGVARFQIADHLPQNDISNFSSEEISINGTLTDQPRIRLNADNSYSVRYTVEVETIKKSQEEIQVSGKIYVNSYFKDESQIDPARIGDKISAYGLVRRPLNYNNPGQLDIVMMLKTDGITATFSVRNSNVEIEEVDGDLWIKFKRLMAAIREHYKESMQKVMSNEDAAAIFAMLFGGYEGLNPELTKSFVTTGIVHILSVSGSHMSLLAATTAWLCNMLGLRRWLKIFIGLFIILSYSILCGFIFPVIRSAFMGFLVFFATSFNYGSNSRRSLTLVAMLILLYSPLSLFHISFQLSFLATAGILYLSPRISYLLLKGAEFKIELYKKIFYPRISFKYFLATSFACTISALIFTQPIVAYYFNSLAISALISNLIVIPILEMIIIFGLFAGIIGLIISPIAKIIFLLDSLALGLAYELNKLIANLPFSNIYFPTINIAWSILYYLILIFLIQKRRFKKKFFDLCRANEKIIQMICAVIIAVIAINIIYQKTRPPQMQVHFIDVHQGDCALVITPNGHSMMFDVGGIRDHKFDVGDRVDIPYLHHYGITKLDYIFLSHCHEDHAEAAGSILKKIPVGEIITAGESKSDYATSMALSDQSPLLKNLRQGVEGEIFEVDGVKVEIIFAPVDNEIATGNEISNVYKVTFGNAKFLFTGDLIKENEEKILREDKDIQSTVLKVAHHGSKTSSSKEFVEAVKPTYAVFCVGADNNFGHPREEVLEIMESVNAKILRTDQNGAIVFTTDGERLKVETQL